MRNRQGRLRLIEAYEFLASEMEHGAERRKLATEDILKNTARVVRLYREMFQEIEVLEGHLDWAMKKLVEHGIVNGQDDVTCQPESQAPPKDEWEVV